MVRGNPFFLMPGEDCSSFIVYKTIVMFILSRHGSSFSNLSSISPEIGIRIRMMVK